MKFKNQTDKIQPVSLRKLAMRASAEETCLLDYSALMPLKIYSEVKAESTEKVKKCSLELCFGGGECRSQKDL